MLGHWLITQLEHQCVRPSAFIWEHHSLHKVNHHPCCYKVPLPFPKGCGPFPFIIRRKTHEVEEVVHFPLDSFPALTDNPRTATITQHEVCNPLPNDVNTSNQWTIEPFNRKSHQWQWELLETDPRWPWGKDKRQGQESNQRPPTI